MHLLYDENGKQIPHGGNETDHHGHVHQETAGHQQHVGKDETLALLAYMLEHNEHHAAELQEMSETLEQNGYKEAADEIREGVSYFRKGNTHLVCAIGNVKKKQEENG